MSDLLAEVDDIMRQERMMALWKAHGGKLIAFLATIILGTAAVSGYNAWNKSQQIESTNTVLSYKEALSFPNNVIEADALDMRADPKALIVLHAAAEAMAQGKANEAIALYKDITTQSSTSKDLKALAYMHLARVSDAESAEVRLGYLQPVLDNKDSPWIYHAHLEAALIEASAQNYGAALAHLNVLQDAAGLPDTLFQKARALSHVYSLKQKDSAL